MKHVDFLIIGSGIAGLSYALKIANALDKQACKYSVCLLTKDELQESNTLYAQGGIAAVMKQADSFEKHISDTLDAGCHLCDKEIVEMVIQNARQEIEQLIAWGTKFDISSSGEYSLAKEGGHSDHRILHHKDMTGREIQRALLDKVMQHPNIEVLEHHYAIELITEHHLPIHQGQEIESPTCFGAYVLKPETNKVIPILSRITLIATGGAGQVYRTTTNPAVATGDGIAMAYRAGADVTGMEFMQFHPTALFHPEERHAFLITEALRGAGAILRNVKGEDFMHRYDPRGSLAPRDIVARAIDSEMKVLGSDHLYLDATHIAQETLLSHFPSIYAKCHSIGVDMRKDYIPVAPAAHYLCGGISVDKYAKTSIKNLLACGESTHTGLHGANRLASNSLLEAIVYAENASKYSLSIWEQTSVLDSIPEWNKDGTSSPEELILISENLSELKAIMTNYVGIVRSTERLARAKRRLALLEEETEAYYKKTTVSRQLLELRNLICIAKLIVRDAQARRSNVGLHFSIDAIKRVQPISL